jgi:hypothetical protein
MNLDKITGHFLMATGMTMIMSIIFCDENSYLFISKYDIFGEQPVKSITFLTIVFTLSLFHKSQVFLLLCTSAIIYYKSGGISDQVIGDIFTLLLPIKLNTILIYSMYIIGSILVKNESENKLFTCLKFISPGIHALGIILFFVSKFFLILYLFIGFMYPIMSFIGAIWYLSFFQYIGGIIFFLLNLFFGYLLISLSERIRGKTPKPFLSESEDISCFKEPEKIKINKFKPNHEKQISNNKSISKNNGVIVTSNNIVSYNDSGEIDVFFHKKKYYK